MIGTKVTAFKTAKFKIQGGKPLDGEVKISGAKNAALPILLSAILTSDTVVLKNVPDLADVKTSFKLLQDLGKQCSYDAKTGEAVISGAVTSFVASYELVKTMRASIMALGPLVAFCGQAEVSLPGGCAIGARPVDLHIKGLQAMGAQMKKPQVPNTARQAASLPGDISRGKRSSMPQPKTRPDSPVPSLQGPCDRSLKSEVPCGSCLNWR